jgi:isoquinoline 1-oxidoreductase beta subunit
MAALTKTTRRNFMKLAAAAGGGLMLGFHWSATEASSMKVISKEVLAAGDINFNSYLSISPEGVITIFSPNPELGQNIKTSFPLIVAEELDADWSKVKVVQAPLDPSRFERQVTGGSGAVPHSWERLRKAGATARHLLMEAAAKRWKVPASSLTAEKSMVIHKNSGRKLSYGQLATEASSIEVPAEIKLKDIKDFKLIGTPVRNVDNHEMVTGKPL